MVTLWNVQSGRLVRTIRGHEGALFGISFSPDGRRLVTAGWDRWLKLWDIATGRETLSIKTDVGYYDAIFDPSGERIATSGHESQIRLYDTLTRSETRGARLSGRTVPAFRSVPGKNAAARSNGRSPRKS